MATLPEAAIGPQTAPSTSLLDDLKKQPAWLLWRSEPNPDPTKKPRKVPYYVGGGRRQGVLDCAEDRAKLVTYAEAVAGYETLAGAFDGLAIALGPDGRGGFVQGIDLDDIIATGVTDIADLWTRGPCAGLAYVEQSPSGVGLHIIGYGRQFQALGANTCGIEAYAGGRFFTFTNKPIVSDSPCRPYDLADYVEQVLSRRHGGTRLQSDNEFGNISVDAKTLTELRSALFHMRADDRSEWITMGHCLKELGETGRGLWMAWSATSDKFDGNDAAKRWDGFKPRNTGYQSVFKHAQDRGWLNPASRAAQPDHAAAGPADEFHARCPRNFLSTAVAPPLSLGDFPTPIADFARACSSAYGFDQSGLVMAAVTAAAAMTHDSYCLEVMPRWYVSARLWTVLIGRSATGKSPILKAATAPVKAKHNELGEDYNLSCSMVEKGEEKPPRTALYTSDATIEALSESLNHNTRGMLVLTEEFSSWIGGIDSSGNGQATKSRGNWLQLYDGGPYQIDRIMRGSILVPNWGASILTASTPTGLAEQMKHLPEDGLIQRFIPVIIGPMNHSADGDAGTAQDGWKRWLYWIYDQTSGGRVIQFSAEARQLFMQAKAEIGRAAEATDDLSSGLASHVSKHTEMIARMALVFHLFDEGPPARLSATTLRRAVSVMAQLRRHSVALFTDILGASPATDIARSLARSLAAAAPEKTAVIGRDWMTQHCRAFEKAKDDRLRREAVQLLEDLDWLRDAGKGNYGGWPKRFEVNRNIFRLYAQEGEIHRARRAEVKAIFEDR